MSGEEKKKSILDHSNFNFFSRFILTQYLVVIWAVNGIRAKKINDDNVPQEIKDFIIAILVIAVVTFLVRVGLVIYRYVRKPLTKMSTVTDIGSK